MRREDETINIKTIKHYNESMFVERNSNKRMKKRSFVLVWDNVSENVSSEDAKCLF